MLIINFKKYVFIYNNLLHKNIKLVVLLTNFKKEFAVNHIIIIKKLNVITHNCGQWTWCGKRPSGQWASHHHTLKSNLELLKYLS